MQEISLLLEKLFLPIVKKAIDETLVNSPISTKPPSASPLPEMPITVKEAAEFMRIKPQTIYQRISKIPHSRRHGRLYFLRSELAEYLKFGKSQ